MESLAMELFFGKRTKPRLKVRFVRLKHFSIMEIHGRKVDLLEFIERSFGGDVTSERNYSLNIPILHESFEIC
jgi:hypothetical protein